MIDVARLLPKILSASNANPELAEIAVKIAWARAAGDGLRRQAIPFRLNRKTLIVSVADSMWQRQLQSMAAELVYRINRLLGDGVVDFIEFRIDPAVVDHARTLTEKRSRDKSPEPAPAEIVSAAGAIADQDLRERFVRAARNCIARRESQGQTGSV